ncbi:hypothetical protein KDI_35290 [Dictyobacter arantiisoli]|uniref:Uncharacterized protein n=2 Tax=Dictyobacter arantiisoli TaxID=2014874 RepID=A0A5A5TFH4_9CHLR|nr:hypothetical protein KDI_35290 [Dictyobacter arantiisoli]
MEEQKATPTPNPEHIAGTGKGEEKIKAEGREPGRQDTGTTGKAKRPTGKTTGRASTGVNAAKENPVDPESPHIPAP